MTLRCALLLPFLLSAAPAVPAADADTDFIRRGHYFTSTDEGIAFWVPGWVNRSKTPRAGMTAEFGIRVMNRFIQMYVVVSGKTLDEILERQQGEATSTFQGGKLELIQPLDGCPQPAFAALFTDIDAVPGFEDKDFIVAATRLDSGRSVTFSLLTAKGHGKAVLPVVRWLINSLGPIGEARLAERSGPRRLDPKTALSYRLPPSLEPAEPTDGVLINARNQVGDETLTVAESTVDALTELKTLAEKSEALRLIRRPHPDGAELTMAYHPPEEKATAGRVQVFVVATDAKPLLVEVVGPAKRREALIDHAELTAASIRRVDVEATRAAALAAATELPGAARGKDHATTRDLVNTLVAGAFVPEARQALVQALPYLAEEEQIRAVGALAANAEAVAATALVKLYRSGKTRKRLAVRRSILRALGSLPDPAARKLLIAEIRAKDPDSAAIAIRALGSARAHRAEVLHPLIQQFKRAEAASRSKKQESRERWLALQPAFETTIERLTGEAFASAQDAHNWYRKHKAEL